MTLVVIFTVPGISLLGHAGLRPSAASAGLVMGVSLAITILIAELLTWARLLSPGFAVAALVVGCAPLLLGQLRAGRR